MSANKNAGAIAGALIAGVLTLSTGAHAQGVAPVAVEETSIARDAFSTGILGADAGGFGSDLWAGASAAELERLLVLTPSRPASPAMGRLLQRLLLTTAPGPQGAPASLGGRKLLALARVGRYDDARTIASLSSAAQDDQWVNQALAVADLLDADLSGACSREDRVNAGRDALFWVKLRVLCYASEDQFDSADLTLGVLREQGSLSDADDALLTAASIPAPLKKPVAPKTALQLALLRRLSGATAAGYEGSADGGVLLSIARNEETDARTRLVAATHAAAIGAARAPTLKALFAGVDAASDMTLADDDILIDAARFQRIAKMTSPEFLRDRATLIAEAVRIAPSFPRAYAAALVYAEDVSALEGVIVAPDEAAAFAIVSMANGRPEAAARWLQGMLGQGLNTVNEKQALEFIDLVNLLGVLDGRQARIVAAAANVQIDPPRARFSAADEIDRERLGAIIAAGFGAASSNARGQLALSAIALTSPAFLGDPVADRVAAAALTAAGLDDVRRRHEFETAWKATFPDSEAVAVTASAHDEDGGFAPSLKPQNP
ncbi:MAG: hypothetical protein GC152_04160 [Alphaproteobacteria bacterium]|nr:hypothetical protein [Alphaproteobacteria bacterium]